AGTMDVINYLGTAKKLPLLKKGDIVFGEAGFHKGRSIVLLEGIENCTTNAHGLYARREDENVDESVFFRCIFNWYRTMRLIDLMAVGGSGGHFSPQYFDYLLIPDFPPDLRERVVRLYHSEAKSLKKPTSLDSFVEFHRRRNEALGIWELHREMGKLQAALVDAQGQIVRGEMVS